MALPTEFDVAGATYYAVAPVGYSYSSEQTEYYGTRKVNTLAAAEALIPTGTFTAQHVINVIGTWGAADTTSVTLTGYTPTEAYRLTIRTIGDARDTYELVQMGTIGATLWVQVPYVTIAALRMRIGASPAGSSHCVRVFGSGASVIFDGCHAAGYAGYNGSNYSGGFFVSYDGSGGSTVVRNCTATGFSSAAGGYGFGFGTWSSEHSFTAQNNTAYNCRNGYRMFVNPTSGRTENNVAKSCGDGYYGTFPTASYNVSDLASDAPGTNPITGAVAFVDADAGDFHLAASDTVATDAGADLSAYFDHDADWTTRTGWSAGAYEGQATAGGTSSSTGSATVEASGGASAVGSGAASGGGVAVSTAGAVAVGSASSTGSATVEASGGELSESGGSAEASGSGAATATGGAASGGSSASQGAATAQAVAGSQAGASGAATGATTVDAAGGELSGSVGVANSSGSAAVAATGGAGAVGSADASGSASVAAGGKATALPTEFDISGATYYAVAPAGYAYSGAQDSAYGARKYTTLAAAATALPASATTPLAINILGTWSSDETTPVAKTLTTTEANQLYVRAIGAARPAGKWDASAEHWRLCVGDGYVTVISINTGFITYDGLAVDSASPAEQNGIAIELFGGNASHRISVHRCVIRTRGWYTEAITITGNSARTVITRCVIEGIGEENCGSAVGASGTLYVYNCTVINFDYALWSYDGYAKNVAFVGCANGYAGDWVERVSYSEDAPSVVDAGNGDYHLLADDTVCLGQGTDLSGDSICPITDDIDGDACVNVSIGADDGPAAGATESVASAAGTAAVGAVGGGSALGAGAATGVGTATASGGSATIAGGAATGSSSSAATGGALAVGAASALGVSAADVVAGALTAVGGVASSSGSGSANDSGGALIAGSASASGSSNVVDTAGALVSASGATTGSATVAATGGSASSSAGAGSSTGSATVEASGGASAVGVGAADGSGVAASTAGATSGGSPEAQGATTAQAVAGSQAGASGAATGATTVDAAGGELSGSVGVASSSGSAAVAATGGAGAVGSAAASGSASVASVGQATAGGTSSSAGSTTVEASGGAATPETGGSASASGSSGVAAVGGADAVGVGESLGSAGTPSATAGALAGASAVASGTATVSAMTTSDVAYADKLFVASIGETVWRADG